MARVYLKDVAKMIDHSLLQPQLTRADVVSGCELAAKYDVASVCVKPCDVAAAAAALRGTSVKTSTVIGFPHGSNVTATKVFESCLAVADGATELDMVINIGYLRSGCFDKVQADIAAVVSAVAGRAIVKVILENALLTDEEKVAACRATEAAGAHFVKTSTGYSTSGSTSADLKLMRATVSPAVSVKAAGGVRTLDAVLEARACGATRCGATATAAIIEEFLRRDPTGEGLLLPQAGTESTTAAGSGATSAIGSSY